MRVRVVVADECEASFFDVDRVHAPMRLTTKLEDDRGRMQDRELETDKPGRSFSRMTHGRSAMDGERSTQRHLQTRFARRIAKEIDKARHRHEFGRLVIMAGPRMLGLIREALPQKTQSAVTMEITKDVVHQDADTIRSYLPKGVFSELAPQI